MKLHSFKLAIGALLAAPALAVAGGSATPMSLKEAIHFMSSQYPGEIVAAELDATGDKAAHYHVDVRFPHGALAKLEVDAHSRRISSRQPAVEPEPGSMTLPQAVEFFVKHVPGNVTLAELDASDGRSMHYHVDVRLPTGKVGRFRIDPVTRDVSWRNPATLDF